MNGIILFNNQFIKEFKKISEISTKKIDKFLCKIGIHNYKKFKNRGIHLTYLECKRCSKRSYIKENYKFYLLDLEWLNNKKIKYPRNMIKLDFYNEDKGITIKKAIKISNSKTILRPTRIRKRHIKRSKKY